MLIKNEKGFYTTDSFSRFENLTHGFSTVSLGSMKANPETNQDLVSKNEELFLNLLNINKNNVVRVKQVHGDKVFLVTELGQELSEADGLVTNLKQISCLVVSADCLPVLFYDPKQEIVGIIHAGWKGTLKEISKKLVKSFLDLGSNVAGIYVGFGPAIEVCHYEVKQDLVDKFKGKDWLDSVFVVREGKIFFDLRAANFNQLISVGFKKENIDINYGSCTFENKDFYSYRREKPSLSGEFASVIGLNYGN